MAHAHHGPSYQPLPAAHAPGHHPSAEDEYLVQPPDAGHEHSDANVRIIVKFGLWLAISAIVISAGVGVLFGLFVKQAEETNPRFPLAVGQEQRLPAAPRLQQFPGNEFFEFRQHENAILQNFGYVNKEAGVVRMPIAEAMRRVVESGLPARAQQPASADATGKPASEAAPSQQTQTLGLMPADSSAGRTMERRRQ
jgi:hypothetical protein